MGRILGVLLGLVLSQNLWAQANKTIFGKSAISIDKVSAVIIEEEDEQKIRFNIEGWGGLDKGLMVDATPYGLGFFTLYPLGPRPDVGVQHRFAYDWAPFSFDDQGEVFTLLIDPQNHPQLADGRALIPKLYQVTVFGKNEYFRSAHFTGYRMTYSNLQLTKVDRPLSREEKFILLNQSLLSKKVEVSLPSGKLFKLYSIGFDNGRVKLFFGGTEALPTNETEMGLLKTKLIEKLTESVEQFALTPLEMKAEDVDLDF